MGNLFGRFMTAVTAPFRLMASLIFKQPLRLLNAPQRLMGLSLPVRVAFFLATFMVILSIIAFVQFYRTGDRSDWTLWLKNILLIVFLITALTVATYWALRLWLEGDKSRFPDIDKAWENGMAELRQNGIDLYSTPLFLVLGASDEAQADSLLEASGEKLAVKGAPAGRNPLRWFASDMAIYLTCPGLGCLGRLNSKGGSSWRGDSPAAGPTGVPPQDITGTLVAGGGDVRGTDVPGAGPTEDSPAPAANPAILGTLVPGGIGETMVPGGGGRSKAAAPTSDALSRGEMDEEMDRLQYVCTLLRRARQPLAPLNGILALMPLPVVQNIMFAKDMPEAVRRDLKVVQSTTRLNAPVLTLVTGMENESGFSELIRRVGMDKAKEARFGKGFKVWNQPTPENLDALSSHACGAFEDWVYSLFREEEGLSKPGNGKLYSLLCNIRSQLLDRMRNVLVQAYGSEATAENQQLFAGCYFASTGQSADRQAFVKGVFKRLSELDEELTWTDAALAEDGRFHSFAQFGMLLNGLMLIGLIGLIVYARYFLEK